MTQDVAASKPTPLAGPASATVAPSSRKKRVLPLLVCAVAATSLAYRSWQGTRPYEWSGTVEARTMMVGSRTGGRIKEVLAREGDHVQAGQALVAFEPGDLAAQRLTAQGQLDQAQALVAKLLRGARPEEVDEARARAQAAAAALEETRGGARSEQIAGENARLVSAQVAVDKAQQDCDRARKLFAADAISAAERDSYESSLRGVIAQRDAAMQVLDELKNGSRREDVQQAAARAIEAQASVRLVLAGSRGEDIAAARGQEASARGKLDAILVALDELVVKAPRAARVETLDLRPGDILAPNATAAELLEDDELYVRIYVPETLIGRIHVDEDVRVVVDSFQDRSFHGVVEHISDVGEYSPRNLQTADERADQVFATRIGLREGKDDLREGMAAFIRVPR